MRALLVAIATIGGCVGLASQPENPIRSTPETTTTTTMTVVTQPNDPTVAFQECPCGYVFDGGNHDGPCVLATPRTTVP